MLHCPLQVLLKFRDFPRPMICGFAGEATTIHIQALESSKGFNTWLSGRDCKAFSIDRVMSGTGNYYDNAMVESFFGVL